MNDAEIRLQVKVDGEGATKSLKKIGDAGKAIGKTVLKGAAIAGTALVGLVGKSVQMAGELEQQIGGTEAVFGKFAGQVQKMGNEAFSKAGLSANTYMATINKMGALMQGSGIEQEKAMNLSAQAMQRAADVASIMGIDVNSAMESIAGAAKGNFTMMDNLGVAMNATTIESYALSKGIKKSYTEMTKAEQVGLAMEMFLQQSAYATGNYAKENETFAGSLSTLKASFDNFMSGVGDIDAVIDSVVSFGTILVTKIIEMAPKIIDGIITLIQNIIPLLPPLIEKLLPAILKGIINTVMALIKMLPTILPILLQALIDGSLMLITLLAKELPTMMPMIVDAILSLIPILIDNMPLFIDAGMQLIIGLAVGLIKAIPTLLEQTPKIIGSFLKLFTALPKKFNQIGGDLIRGLWQGIKDVTQWLYNKISGFVDGVVGKIKNFFGIKSPSKEFEIIGKYNVEGLEEGMKAESKIMNRNIGDMFGTGLDLASKMGLNGGDYTSALNIGNQRIIVENYNTMLLDGSVVYENQQQINQYKNIQTGFGG